MSAFLSLLVDETSCDFKLLALFEKSFWKKFIASLKVMPLASLVSSIARSLASMSLKTMPLSSYLSALYSFTWPPKVGSSKFPYLNFRSSLSSLSPSGDNSQPNILRISFCVSAPFCLASSFIASLRSQIECFKDFLVKGSTKFCFFKVSMSSW